jgi:histidinol-phosphate aminotransferase
VRAFAGPGKNIVQSQYGFSIPGIFAKKNGADVLYADEVDFTAHVDNILKTVDANTRVVFLANPNNPTGTAISFEEILRLRDGLPGDILLVLDAAYAEYNASQDYSAYHQLSMERSDVVVTRTFSKAFGLAGARLGWATAHPDIINLMDSVREPFNVNMSAQVAGIAALDDKDFLDLCISKNAELLPQFTNSLRQAGVIIPDSYGNFVMADFSPLGEGVAAKVLKNCEDNGIILRPLAPYGLKECLRITIGTSDEVEKTIKAIVSVLQT